MFTLQPNPTFTTDIAIPRAGTEDGVLSVTFKHKTLDELTALEKETGIDFLLEVISAWGLPEPFSRENLSKLHQNYPSSLSAIINKFYSELTGIREKN